MEIKEYLKENFPEMKKALARLIRIPSVSGKEDGKYPFGAECGKALEEFLKLLLELVSFLFH